MGLLPMNAAAIRNERLRRKDVEVLDALSIRTEAEASRGTGARVLRTPEHATTATRGAHAERRGRRALSQPKV